MDGLEKWRRDGYKGEETDGGRRSLSWLSFSFFFLVWFLLFVIIYLSKGIGLFNFKEEGDQWRAQMIEYNRGFSEVQEATEERMFVCLRFEKTKGRRKPGRW